MLLDAETEETSEAPSGLVVNEAVEELAALDHGSFELLLGVCHAFDFVFILVGLRRRRVHVAHQRAPEPEALIRTDEHAEEVRDYSRDASNERQYLVK